MNVPGDLIRPIAAVILRKPSGKRVDRSLRKPDCSEHGAPVQEKVSFVAREAVRQEFLNRIRLEEPVLGRLEGRGVSRPPILATEFQAVFAVNIGQVVFVLELPVGEELRQAARVPETHHTYWGNPISMAAF